MRTNTFKAALRKKFPQKKDLDHFSRHLTLFNQAAISDVFDRQCTKSVLTKSITFFCKLFALRSMKTNSRRLTDESLKNL
jgi:hypothetical protein